MKGPGMSCRGIKIFWSWVMVMGRWRGRVVGSGVSGLLRVLCEEERAGRHCRCPGGELSPSADGSNDPRPKGAYLQADLGRVQWKGEEVSKAGRCARPQELHSRCGRHL